MPGLQGSGQKLLSFLSCFPYLHSPNDSTSPLLIYDGVTLKKRQTDLSYQTEMILHSPLLNTPSKYTSGFQPVQVRQNMLCHAE